MSPENPSDPSAEPPEQAAVAEPLVGRERLLRSLRTPSRRQVVVGVLLGVLGFASVVQLRVAGSDTTYASYREQDLIDALNGLAATTQRTQTEIDRLTQARDDLRSDSTRRRAALDQAQQEVDALSVLAGLVPVTGPGIRVTITEGSGPISVGAFLDTIQELRSVGAEAIQVNGEVRLVAQSSVGLGTAGLVIDGTVVESPFVIDAIGESSTLAGAMNFALGPRSELENDGATVEVDERGSLDIDAIAPLFDPDVGEPAS